MSIVTDTILELLQTTWCKVEIELVNESAIFGKIVIVPVTRFVSQLGVKLNFESTKISKLWEVIVVVSDVGLTAPDKLNVVEFVVESDRFKSSPEIQLIL